MNILTITIRYINESAIETHSLFYTRDAKFEMEKEEKIMKCVICHGNEIEVRQVKEECVVGNDIVCVPINSCLQIF